MHITKIVSLSFPSVAYRSLKFSDDTEFCINRVFLLIRQTVETEFYKLEMNNCLV